MVVAAEGGFQHDVAYVLASELILDGEAPDGEGARFKAAEIGVQRPRHAAASAAVYVHRLEVGVAEVASEVEGLPGRVDAARQEEVQVRVAADYAGVCIAAVVRSFGPHAGVFIAHEAELVYEKGIQAHPGAVLAEGGAEASFGSHLAYFLHGEQFAEAQVAGVHRALQFEGAGGVGEVADVEVEGGATYLRAEPAVRPESVERPFGPCAQGEDPSGGYSGDGSLHAEGAKKLLEPGGGEGEVVHADVREEVAHVGYAGEGGGKVGRRAAPRLAEAQALDLQVVYVTPGMAPVEFDRDVRLRGAGQGVEGPGIEGAGIRGEFEAYLVDEVEEVELGIVPSH